MSASVRPEIEDFFATYDAASSAGDPEALRRCFAETFLNADPTGAGPVERELLLRSLPARRGLFASVGVEGLDLASVAESPIDERHTLADTTWTARFRPDAPDTTPLTLRAHFLLRREPAGWQILLYLNHDDLPALFRARLDGAPGKPS